DGGEGGDQQVVHRLAGGEFGAELVGSRPQRLVAERLHLRFQRVDGFDAGADAADTPVIGRAENLPRECAKTDHERPFQFLNNTGLTEPPGRVQGRSAALEYAPEKA